MHRDQLVKEIATLKKEVKDPKLPEDIRVTLQAALVTAEGMLEKMDKDKAKVMADPRLDDEPKGKPKSKVPPGAMTHGEMMKKLSPESRAELNKKPSAVDKDEKELNDCMKILAAYKAKKQKTENKRVEKRLAAGKPAELTIPETVKKAVKTVETKIEKKEDAGKTITKPETKAVIAQITKLVTDVLEVQNDDATGRETLNLLVSAIEGAAKKAGISPKSTGLKFAKGGQLGTDWDDDDEYFHVRMTIKKVLGTAKDMSAERRVLHRSLEYVRKIAAANDITLDRPMRNYQGDSTLPDINGFAALGPDCSEIDKAIKDGFANFKTKAKQKEYLDNVTRIVHFIGIKEEKLGYRPRSFRTQFAAGGEIAAIRNTDLKTAVTYLENTGLFKLFMHKGSVDRMGNGERVIMKIDNSSLYALVQYDPMNNQFATRLLTMQGDEFYTVGVDDTKYRLDNGRAIERAINSMRTGSESPVAVYKENGGFIDMIGGYRGRNMSVLSYQTKNFDTDEQAARVFSLLVENVHGKAAKETLVLVAEDVDRALGILKMQRIGKRELSDAISLTMRAMYMIYPVIADVDESLANTAYPTFLHTNIVKILVKMDMDAADEYEQPESVEAPVTIEQEEPSDIIKQLTDNDLTMINDILSNDENSSDAEVVEVIVESLKLNAKDAAQIVAFYRDKFLRSATYTLPGTDRYASQDIEQFKADAASLSLSQKKDMAVVRRNYGELTVVPEDEMEDELTSYPRSQLIGWYSKGKPTEKKLFGGLIGVRAPDNFSLAHNGDTNLAFKKGGPVPKRKSAKDLARSLKGMKPRKKYLFGGQINVRPSVDNFTMAHNGDTNLNF